jgi:hypothetical protein
VVATHDVSTPEGSVHRYHVSVTAGAGAAYVPGVRVNVCPGQALVVIVGGVCITGVAAAVPVSGPALKNRAMPTDRRIATLDGRTLLRVLASGAA